MNTSFRDVNVHYSVSLTGRGEETSFSRPGWVKLFALLQMS